MVLSSCEEKEVRFMLWLLLVLSLVERGSLVAAIATAAEQPTRMMMTALQHASKPLRCLGKCIEEKQSMRGRNPTGQVVRGPGDEKKKHAFEHSNS